MFLNKRDVSKQTVFVSILTYGTESWVLTDRVKSKLTAMEMKILRKIEVVTILDKIRNEAIKENFGIVCVVCKIE